MNTIHYFAGEVKRLRLKVYSRENPLAQIIVSGATWELHGLEGKIIDRGHVQYRMAAICLFCCMSMRRASTALK